MTFTLRKWLTIAILLLLSSCQMPQRWSGLPAPTATSSIAQPTPSPNSTNTPSPDLVEAGPTLAAPLDPYAFLSEERLLETIKTLTRIEPYSGWRNSGSQGEREAIAYLQEELAGLDFLAGTGLEVERQDFSVFLSTELWETQLLLDFQGRRIAVPVNGLRGPRDDIQQALRFDSDGQLNDAAPDPVTVDGSILLIRTQDDLDRLTKAASADKIIFLDYALIDRAILGVPTAVRRATELLKKAPAGLVLVTRFSNTIGESHGTFVGDVSALDWVTAPANPPTVYVRFEDLALIDIHNWDDLTAVEGARLTWDADIFSPGTSHNLIARIPGKSSEKAVLLTAHIDSANTPGALDDAVGSAILLEMAQVYDEAYLQPETDIYLVWFGSQALGFYGSYNFAAQHQELLDRTIAVLQVDSLSHPLDGIEADLSLVGWSYGRLGDDQLPWPSYLAQAAQEQGITVKTENLHQLETDNTIFTAFDVPNAHLIYLNRQAMGEAGGIHYASHSHDPYDTIDLVYEQAAVMMQMARLTLAASLEASQYQPDLRVTPDPTKRVLFIASHTEAVHMTAPTFTDFGMTFAMAGFDVDMIPYGQPVTPDDLRDADLAVVLPVVDYPSPGGDPTQYNTAWQEDELVVLENYVATGGMLVITNSANRLKYGNWLIEANEDWRNINALAARFGVTFYGRALSGQQALIELRHPLTEGVNALAMAETNGVAFLVDEEADFFQPALEGQIEILASVGDDIAAALLHGANGGRVLVLGDVGMLGSDWNAPPVNLRFWQQLASYSADPF